MRRALATIVLVSVVAAGLCVLLDTAESRELPIASDPTIAEQRQIVAEIMHDFPRAPQEVSREEVPSDSADDGWSNIPRTDKKVWQLFRLKPSSVSSQDLFRNEVLNPLDRKISVQRRETFAILFGEYASRIQRLRGEFHSRRANAALSLIDRGEIQPIDFEAFAARTDIVIQLNGGQGETRKWATTGKELIRRAEKSLGRQVGRIPPESQEQIYTQAGIPHPSSDELEHHYAQQALHMAWRRANSKPGDVWHQDGDSSYVVRGESLAQVGVPLRECISFLVNDLIGVTIQQFGNWGVHPQSGILLEETFRWREQHLDIDDR